MKGECGVSNGCTPIHIHTSKLFGTLSSVKNGRVKNDGPIGDIAPKCVGEERDGDALQPWRSRTRGGRA